MLTIQAISAFNDNYIWLIEDPDTRRVLIIDPGDAAPVINAINQQQLIPSAILITHHHSDHIGGITALTKQYKLPVYGPESESIIGLTHPLSDNPLLMIDPAFPVITVLAVPGHTAGHIAFLINDCLFCGDTLFAAGCGRLLGGTAEELFHSLQQLATLPIQTRIFCAHEYTEANLRFAATVEPKNIAIQQRIKDTSTLRQQNLPSLPSTLALELATNPFLRCDQEALTQSVQQFSGKTLSTPVEVFSALRAWKDLF